MGDITPVQIYPSQLETVKSKEAKTAELLLSRIAIDMRLSKLKANDYFANALGYKGYPDLQHQSKKLSQSEKDEIKAIIKEINRKNNCLPAPLQDDVLD